MLHRRLNTNSGFCRRGTFSYGSFSFNPIFIIIPIGAGGPNAVVTLLNEPGHQNCSKPTRNKPEIEPAPSDKNNRASTSLANGKITKIPLLFLLMKAAAPQHSRGIAVPLGQASHGRDAPQPLCPISAAVWGASSPLGSLVTEAYRPWGKEQMPATFHIFVQRWFGLFVHFFFFPISFFSLKP